MILSVSRRTDIPAFYSTWFMNRLRDGIVLVRNPMNYHQVSEVCLDPKLIDCIVFWTKNGAPLLSRLDEINAKFPFYFQYTLNSYCTDIEPALPSLESRIATFKAISQKIGPERVIWRYDPILLTNKYTVEWHISEFKKLAIELENCTETCVFSFIDIYPKVENNIKEFHVHPCNIDEMNTLAAAFSDIACQHHLHLRTCAEQVNLDKFGIAHGSCIDGDLISRITRKVLKAKKDPNQRSECGCLESIDIGQYNTCRHGCKYCYANFNPQSVRNIVLQHDEQSQFLIGHLEAGDKVTERKMKSLLMDANEQLSMF